MTRLLLVLGIFLVPDYSISQIYPHGLHRFEKLSWGQNLSECAKSLGNISLKELRQSDDDSFFNTKSDCKTFTFDDTLFSTKAFVGLIFDNKSLQLKGVMITFFWLGELKDNGESIKIWEKLKAYYATPLKEKTVPFYGSSMSWKYYDNDILAIRAVSAKTTSVVINISQVDR